MFQIWFISAHKVELLAVCEGEFIQKINYSVTDCCTSSRSSGGSVQWPQYLWFAHAHTWVARSEHTTVTWWSCDCFISRCVIFQKHAIHILQLRKVDYNNKNYFNNNSSNTIFFFKLIPEIYWGDSGLLLSGARISICGVVEKGKSESENARVCWLRGCWFLMTSALGLREDNIPHPSTPVVPSAPASNCCGSVLPFGIGSLLHEIVL